LHVTLGPGAAHPQGGISMVAADIWALVVFGRAVQLMS